MDKKQRNQNPENRREAPRRPDSEENRKRRPPEVESRRRVPRQEEEPRRRVPRQEEESRRRAPRQEEEPRRRPPRQEEEPRRRPLRQEEEPRKRPPRQEEEPQKRPHRQEEEPRKRPPRQEEEPRKRPPRQEEEPRKRPSHQEEESRKRAPRQEEEPRKKPAEARSRQEAAAREEAQRRARRQQMAEEARKKPPVKAPAKKKPAPEKAGTADSILDRFIPGRKERRANEPPQGTSYQRSTKMPGQGLFGRRAGTRPSEAIARKNARAEEAEHKKKQAIRFDTPAVVYTQPKPFNRNRLFIQVVTVLAVAVAFVMGLSVFFKVKVITVSGAETYSAYAVMEASGIREGDPLLTSSRARACSEILANLPYVKKARIGIKLPDTVNIDIEEEAVAYSVMAQDGGWWLMTSDGKITEQINIVTAENYTKILGVTIDTPIVGEQAVATEAPPAETLPEGETVPVAITGAQQLRAVYEILQAMENNDIVGEATSVDVGNMQEIELWYGQRYQVNLGDSSNLTYKIECMYDVILQMEEYQTGMLDISFQTISDQVIYTPFA